MRLPVHVEDEIAMIWMEWLNQSHVQKFSHLRHRPAVTTSPISLPVSFSRVGALCHHLLVRIVHDSISRRAFAEPEDKARPAL